MISNSDAIGTRYHWGTPFLEPPAAPTHIVIPYYCADKMEGETYGVELTADWEPLRWWRPRAAYTYLQIQLHLDADSNNIFEENEARGPDD